MLLDEIADDSDSGFLSHRDALAEAFRDRRLYTLSVRETDALFATDGDASANDVFVAPCFPWLLPCAAVVACDDPRTLDLLWVHIRVRPGRLPDADAFGVDETRG